uniref:Secreted protein n=1 Tax=Anguilla anguilla TaxID=7936 RepID=A0A0E9TZ57_ANGAN
MTACSVWLLHLAASTTEHRESGCQPATQRDWACLLQTAHHPQTAALHSTSDITHGPPPLCSTC